MLTVSQVSWTKEVEQAIAQGDARGLAKYQAQMQQEMNDTVAMVRVNVDKLVRINLGALIVPDVHNLNTVKNMAVESTNDFTAADADGALLHDAGGCAAATPGRGAGWARRHGQDGDGQGPGQEPVQAVRSVQPLGQPSWTT